MLTLTEVPQVGDLKVPHVAEQKLFRETDLQLTSGTAIAKIGVSEAVRGT